VNRRGLWNYILCTLVCLALADSAVALPGDERAYIEFERVGVSRHDADLYTVRKGECLFTIVRRHYTVSKEEALRLLELVGNLNPQLKDINRIYPGQRVLLPRKRPLPAEQATSGGLSGEREGSGVLRYVVKKGESVSFIIHRFGHSGGGIYRILQQVRRLNPEVKDFNRVYPGQVLLFPPEVRREAGLPAGKGDIVVPEGKILPMISHIAGRMGGVVITDGKYGIPVPPSGEVTIDCTKIPVIEMPGGNTILLDLSDRIPASLERVIETAWHTYRVVDVEKGGAVPSLLERIFRAAGGYTLEKIGRQTKIGGTPEVQISVGWLVSRNAETGGSGRYAFNFMTERSDILPLPVKRYALRNGLDIIEIMDGLGVTDDEAAYQAPPLQVLNPGSGLVLACSFLGMLGYVPAAGGDVTVLSGEGVSLSMRAELLLEREGRRVVITSRKVPDQVLHILRERGDRIVAVSEERSRREIIEDIARDMEIPHVYDDFRFSLSRHAGKERGGISLPALRIGDDRGLYLVDYDVDEDIRKLLHEEWKVTLVRY